MLKRYRTAAARPEWYKRLITSHAHDLSRGEYALRLLIELCKHGAKQLRLDRAGQMAAALSFRTIFGLVPLTVIGLLIFRTFGGLERFGGFLRQLLSSMQLDEIRIPVEAAADDATAAQDVSLVDWVADLITKIDANVNFESIGMVGLLLLAWAAIGLMTTIERSFNTICQASENRPLSRRVPLYWLTLTLGPALLYLSFVLDNRLDAWVAATFSHFSQSWIAHLASLVGLIASLVSTWLFVLLLYEFVPNIRLKWASAAFGAAVAAVLWALGARAMGAYVSLFGLGSNYSILYGTLGLIPVFLLWVYVMWVVVLFGLEIAMALQVVRVRMGQPVIPEKPPLPPMMDPALVLPLMEVIAQRFREGQTIDAAQIVESTRINERAVDVLLATLTERGYLHRVEGRGSTAYVLAKPPESMAASELLMLAHGVTGTASGGPDSAAWRLVRRLNRVQLDAVGKSTLAEPA